MTDVRTASRRVELLGCPVDLMTTAEVVAELDAAIRSRSAPRIIHFVNGNKIAKVHSDQQMREILWRGDYVLADGQPLLPMARQLGIHIPERIDGIGLMERLLALADERAYGIYLLGARQNVLERCAATIAARHHNLRIVGLRNGYFGREEWPTVVDAINATGADMLFIGIGSPIKEQFADEERSHLRIPVVQGVGGSFDVIAGLVTRAPIWMQRAGLEWLYRVLQEPGRMFWRYATTNALCLWIFAGEWLRRRVARVSSS